MEVHEDGYKDLMEEGGNYGAWGVLIDGEKWYLQCIRCDVGSFVEGFVKVEVRWMDYVYGSKCECRCLFSHTIIYYNDICNITLTPYR